MTKWLTVKELQKRTGKPRSTVLDMIKRDKLETKKEEREIIKRQMVTLVRIEE